MTETVGTLNLKIERLQQRLEVLTLKQAMSRAYPEIHSIVQQEIRSVRLQVGRLIYLRSRLSQGVNTRVLTEEVFTSV